VLTEKFILGMNVLSLAGFALIAISLALARRGNLRARLRRIRVRIAVVLMIGGTALVCFGLYLMPSLIP
jgi:hypothetical protein